jgi:hypothetical protein
MMDFAIITKMEIATEETNADLNTSLETRTIINKTLGITTTTTKVRSKMMDFAIITKMAIATEEINADLNTSLETRTTINKTLGITTTTIKAKNKMTDFAIITKMAIVTEETNADLNMSLETRPTITIKTIMGIIKIRIKTIMGIIKIKTLKEEIREDRVDFIKMEPVTKDKIATFHMMDLKDNKINRFVGIFRIMGNANSVTSAGSLMAKEEEVATAEVEDKKEENII